MSLRSKNEAQELWFSKAKMDVLDVSWHALHVLLLFRTHHKILQNHQC